MINLAPTVSLQYLRVFVAARNAVDYERLQALVREAGHQPADSADRADFMLSEEKGPVSNDSAILILAGPGMDRVGSLTCDATPAQLDAALRAAAVGLLVRSPASTPPGFGALADHSTESLLTPREIEVLECIGEGLTNKLIARRLDISLHTVKFHIESLLRKLGATTRAQALALLLERRRSRTIEF